MPAFTGLGAPYWDMYARGALLGVTRGTTRAHLCRAVLESIALESADLVEAMKRESGVAIPELRADGGASRSRFLMQYQADILNTRVCRPQCLETTALGSAMMAGLTVGLWDSLEELSSLWRESAVPAGLSPGQAGGGLSPLARGRPAQHGLGPAVSAQGVSRIQREEG